MRGLLSFDDLLSLTADAVKSVGSEGEALRRELRESFDAAMIDEFRDTDPVQFEIFRELFGETGTHWLYLIGDPKQSIYRFRGADLKLTSISQRKPGRLSIRLTPIIERSLHWWRQSMRSSVRQTILSFIQNFLSTVKPNKGGGRTKTKSTRKRRSSMAFVIRELDWRKEKDPSAPESRQAIRKDMANEIHRLLTVGSIGSQPVRFKDIAVLVRSNHEAREVWKFFRKENCRQWFLLT